MILGCDMVYMGHLLHPSLPSLLLPSCLLARSARRIFYHSHNGNAIVVFERRQRVHGIGMGSTSSVHSVPCTLIAYGYSLCPLPWPHFHVQ